MRVLPPQCVASMRVERRRLAPATIIGGQLARKAELNHEVRRSKARDHRSMNHPMMVRNLIGHSGTCTGDRKAQR